MTTFCYLGNIAYTPLTGFTEHQETQRFDYAEHSLIEGKPDLQWVGSALVERDIAMRFHAKYCNPKAQLAKLKEAAAGREALTLVMGDGSEPLGVYVITEITCTTVHTDPSGFPFIIDVSVKLKEYITSRSFDVATPGVRWQ